MKTKTSPLYYLFVTSLAIVFFFPVFWILLTSLKAAGEIYAWPPVFLPRHPTFKNYVAVLFQSNLGRYIVNSVLVSSLTTVSVIFLAALAGYALARLRFKGAGFLLIYFLSLSMFPQLSIAPSIFLWFRKLGLINSFGGIVFAYSGLFLPMAVWIMTTYFKTVPPDIEESAKMDGCPLGRIIFQILVPVSLPGVVAAGLIMFIYSWNEFFLSLIVLTKDSLRTATVGIALYPGEYAFPWELITTATFLAVLPLVLLVFFFQKKIIGGLTAGAVKS